MRLKKSLKNIEVIKKILDYLGIYEFERKRPPPKIHTYCDEFDDYSHDDYIDCDYMDI